MTPRSLRRLVQLAVGVALAGTVVLVTAWAYPAGHLAVRLGRPYYSRPAGTRSLFVTVDIALRNVGATPVQIDRERFILLDETGRRYASDPSTHFLRNHFDVITILPAREIQGATVFQIPEGHRAARMILVTTTGEIVRLPLPR